MYRYIEEKLKKWNNFDNKKPLMINGARQVGKSYTMKYFGKKNFKNVLYIDFNADNNFNYIIKLNTDPEEIIKKLAKYVKISIDSKTTLIILDHIELNIKTINLLKYYSENKIFNILFSVAPNELYNKQNITLLKNYIDILNMYPMNFEEFLYEIDKKTFNNFVKNCSRNLSISNHKKILDYFKLYLIIGGMPKAVDEYTKTKDLFSVQEIQQDIINIFFNDIKKYNTKVSTKKMILIINILYKQFLEKNIKFKFDFLIKKGRYSAFIKNIDCLIDIGIINSIHKISEIKIPLSEYKINKIFKLYLCDVGLFCKISNININAILNDKEFLLKKAVYETYVLEQLHSHNIECFYYSENKANVEIIFENDNKIIVVNVGAEKNIVLKHIIKKYNLTKGYNLTVLPYIEDENIVLLPFYAVNQFS